ncbi:MAG: DUF3108 domain-containing protein [Brevinematales bacterium]
MPALKVFKILTFIIAAAFFLSFLSCAGFNRQRVPMKVSLKTDIRDGEYLKYGYYLSGEKQSETCMVTRKETGSNGDLLYRVYMAETEIPGGRKIPGNYLNWPSYYLIDPSHGCVLESVFIWNTNDIAFKTKAQDIPYSSLIYSCYQLHMKEGYVKYVSRSMKNTEIIERNYRVDVKADYPVWDGISFFYFPSRMMDIRGGGTMYIVTPEFLKDATPFSLKYKSREKVVTKAGDFSTFKVSVITDDPFLERLAEPILKKASFWVEDSPRKLTVRIQFAFGGGVVELEEISNVIDNGRF